MCVPSCIGQNGVYPSIHWAGGVCRGGVCLGGVCPEGCLPGRSLPLVLGLCLPPRGGRHNPRTRGRHPPRRTRGRHPPMGSEADTPPGTRGRHPPVRYYRIRSTSGRYASYWNAFLLLHVEKPATDDVLFLFPKNHGCLQKV